MNSGAEAGMVGRYVITYASVCHSDIRTNSVVMGSMSTSQSSEELDHICTLKG